MQIRYCWRCGRIEEESKDPSTHAGQMMAWGYFYNEDADKLMLICPVCKVIRRQELEALGERDNGF